jgi:hypothetical protein
MRHCQARFVLERLEDRTVPAQIFWSGGSGGNGTDWLTAGNWVGNAVPGPNDDAVLNPTGTSPTVTLVGSTTVKSVSCNRNLQLTGSQTNLTVGGAGTTNTVFLNLQLTAGTNLNLTDGAVLYQSAISGPGSVNISGPATATLTGATTVAASVNVTGGGTMIVGGSTLGGTTIVASGSTLRVPANDQMNVTGSLSNNGTLDMLGFRILVTGTLNNNSLLVSHAGGAASNAILVASTGQFNSTGTIRANTSDLVIRPNVINPPGNAALSGQVVADVGRSVSVVQLPVSVNFTATGGGNVLFSGDTVAGSGISNPSATLTLSGCNFVANLGGGGPYLTASFGQTLALQQTRCALNILGAATIGSGVVLGGSDGCTISAGGVLTMQADATGSASLAVYTDFRNQGTIQLIADPPTGSALTVSGFDLADKGLTNLPGGLITTLAGAGKSTISLASSTYLVAFSNLGTLTPTGRDLTISLSGLTAFTNTGTVYVPAGRTLTVTGGPFTNAFGTLSGFGTVVASVAGTGTTSPGQGAVPGQLTLTGSYTQPPDGTLTAKLNGTTVGTQYDQLKVNGTVSIGGTLNLSVGFAPTVGSAFTIIDNDGTDAVTGTFAGLPEGTTLTVGGTTFRISYAGGTGNDVVVTVMASQAGAVSSVVVNGGAAQRSMVTQATVTFSRLVAFTGQTAAAFQMARTGPGTPTSNVTLAVDLTGSTATQTIAKLTFSGLLTEGPNSLVDGNYTLTVLSSQVQFGLQGGDSVTSLFRLFGDVNGDRTVNITDLTAFRNAFGTISTDTSFLPFLDFNGDGVINLTDLTQFRNRFGVILP